MPDRRSSARQSLLQAAVQLFITQGVTETTTRQIADQAGVNEVTLFRNFGSKYGLLLAMMEDQAILRQLSQALGQPETPMAGASQSLKTYASVHLQALEQIQEFVRSLIGEAAHYPVENRRALGRNVSQANRYTAQYLAAVMQNEHLQTRMSTDKLASLLNSLLLGYAVLEFTSDINELWQRRDSFIDGLVELFLYGAIAPSVPVTSSISVTSSVIPEELNLLTANNTSANPPLQDLPAPTIHNILKRAKKIGLQEYAIAYTLFAAGLNAEELIHLRRTDVEISRSQISLRLPDRQAPLIQMLGDRRYGTPPNNPLTQWLKSRKDNHSSAFISSTGKSLSVTAIQQLWAAISVDPKFLDEPAPTLEQSQHTWRIEMLVRGMSVENLSLLTGLSTTELQPYVRRAREKAALEQAAQLDQRSANTKREKLTGPLLEDSLSEIAPEI